MRSRAGVLSDTSLYPTGAKEQDHTMLSWVNAESSRDGLERENGNTVSQAMQWLLQ